uniref:Putative HAD superfamily phosphatase n=1 Tax=Amycolatopsis sp. SANK 60206 TaxID=1642649 RepID=A0A0E3Z7K8_9PSEU|nr:putative HAD superfamily phosphatase [Amycolatopsis sp. SANK 60206]
MLRQPWEAECAVLLLDLDGTLVDSTEAVLRGWHAWARSIGVPTAGLESLVIGRSAASAITTLLPDVTAEQLRRHIDYVLTVQEHDSTPAFPMRGAGSLVGQLEATQWAVVTGCSLGMAYARLAAGGLPRPRVLVTDEDVASGKPDPGGYLLALRRLGIDATDAIAVEDSPAGIMAARAAGIRTVAVATTHRQEALSAADVVASHLGKIRVTEAAGRRQVTVYGEARP